MADSRLTVVVRPEASVVLTVVRVVPDLLTRLSTVVEGFCVVVEVCRLGEVCAVCVLRAEVPPVEDEDAELPVEPEVLDEPEEPDEVVEPDLPEAFEELSRLGEVCAVWVLRAEVPPVVVEVAELLVELVERAETELLFSFSLAA